MRAEPKDIAPGGLGRHEGLLLVLAGALLSLLLLPGSEALRGPPALGPVMPEMDGVHPARAVQALHEAWAPGQGFLDKYPPLGSALFGLVVAWQDGEYPSAAQWLALERPERRQAEWLVAEATQAALAAQRKLSQLAMALGVGVALALAAQLARRVGVHNVGARRLAAAITFVALAGNYPLAYYGSTANVDALAWLPSLAALWASLSGRHRAAAAAAALATAVKDPAFVLGPVVLLGALLDGRPGRVRRLLATLGIGLGVYALATGALLAPQTWWRHVTYLVSGGVEGVERIDPTDVGAWPGLIAYAGRLVLGAQGVVVPLLGLVGLGWALRRDPPGVLRLGLVLLATLLLFVIPAGFVYVRFLLVPLAVLAVGCGVFAALALHEVLRRAPPDARGRLIAVTVLLGGFLLGEGLHDLLLGGHAWGRAPNGPLTTLAAMVEPGADPREQVMEWFDEHVEPGQHVVLFADGREAGPPVDPRRVRYEVLGLDEAPHALAEWRAEPSTRPDWLLWMSFPTEPPSGRPMPRHDLRREGEVVADSFEVVGLFGRPRLDVVERTLAVRPVLTVLRRLP